MSAAYQSGLKLSSQGRHTEAIAQYEQALSEKPNDTKVLFALGSRTRLDISAQHDRNPLFVRLSDGSVRNAYTVKLRNMESRPREVTIAMEGLAEGKMWPEGSSRDAASGAFDVKLAPDTVTKLRLFVVTPAGDGSRKDFALTVKGADDAKASDRHEVVLERGGE